MMSVIHNNWMFEFRLQIELNAQVVFESSSLLHFPNKYTIRISCQHYIDIPSIQLLILEYRVVHLRI